MVVDSISKPIVSEEYKTNYINRMVKDADVHYHSINFNAGDYVLICRSFDNNTQTRKEKLSSFFEDGIWKIIESVGRDNYRLSRLGDDDNISPIVVVKNRLRKADFL